MERRKSVGGSRTRERTRGELRVRIEPVRVATPVYRRPGVKGSSGAMSDFIRPFRKRNTPLTAGEMERESEKQTFDPLFDSNPS